MSRDRNGQYKRVSVCHLCGKSAGVDYFSDARVNTWPGCRCDLGLVLCRRCAPLIEQMNDHEAHRALSISTGSGCKGGAP